MPFGYDAFLHELTHKLLATSAVDDTAEGMKQLVQFEDIDGLHIVVETLSLVAGDFWHEIPGELLDLLQRHMCVELGRVVSLVVGVVQVQPLEQP